MAGSLGSKIIPCHAVPLTMSLTIFLDYIEVDQPFTAFSLALFRHYTLLPLPLELTEKGEG